MSKIIRSCRELSMLYNNRLPILSMRMHKSKCLMYASSWMSVFFNYFFKGLCHKNIAVLGQFCAEAITKCLCHEQNALRFSEKDIKQFSSESTNYNYIFLRFSSFNPILSLQSAATDNRKWFRYPDIVRNFKTWPQFLEFSWREDIFKRFIKIANSLT